jgi:hypothetical protein
MEEDTNRQSDLVDTTDCLEAIGVFRGWKNALFMIVVFCLLLLQASFWLVNLGCIKGEGCQMKCPLAAAPQTAQVEQAAVEEKAKIEEAAKEAVAGTEVPAETPQKPEGMRLCPWLSAIRFEWLARLIRILNFVVTGAAILYCLTMMFCLKVSLLGRLGGINHISRAFFLSLVMAVLLLPWQRVFGEIFIGAIYTPEELLSRCGDAGAKNIFVTALHYLRFTGYWVVVMLFLILSQIRSSRWAKATLRRLEVI